MKTKILLILFTLTCIMLGSGLTYSIFHSRAEAISNNQEIAQFIFEAKKSNEIELELMDLNPKDSKEYNFSVTNNYMEKTSHVALNYQIIIRTYHFVPLVIELYKSNGLTEQLVMTCDESYSRNEKNELVCNSTIQTMDYKKEELDDYKLKITFPEIYNSNEYAGLVDYIDLEIKSWQKTE